MVVVRCLEDAFALVNGDGMVAYERELLARLEHCAVQESLEAEGESFANLEAGVVVERLEAEAVFDLKIAHLTNLEDRSPCISKFQLRGFRNMLVFSADGTGNGSILSIWSTGSIHMVLHIQLKDIDRKWSTLVAGLVDRA